MRPGDAIVVQDEVAAGRPADGQPPGAERDHLTGLRATDQREAADADEDGPALGREEGQDRAGVQTAVGPPDVGRHDSRAAPGRVLRRGADEDGKFAQQAVERRYRVGDDRDITAAIGADDRELNSHAAESAAVYRQLPSKRHTMWTTRSYTHGGADSRISSVRRLNVAGHSTKPPDSNEGNR